MISKAGTAAGCLWMFTVIALCLVTDVGFPESKETSDFLSSFYVAGLLVLRGDIASLYPPVSADTYVGLPFDRLTHELFVRFPAELPAMFMYAPLVAVLCAPFAFFQPGISLLLWQLTGLICLLAAAVWSAEPEQSKANEGSASAVLRWWQIAIAGFAFLPVVVTLWIGQSGLLFATFPLAAAIRYLLRQREFCAGLWLSLMFLKPQVYPVALLIGFGTAMMRRPGCAAGLACGTAVLIALSAFVLGFDAFARWLHSLSVSETLLSTASVRSPLYLIAGLPGAVVSQLAPEWRAAGKWLVYGCGAGLFIAQAALLVFVSRAKASLQTRMAVTIVAATLALPIYSPRLLLYDLCVFVPAAALIFYRSRAEFGGLRRSLTAAWCLINAYILLIVLSSDVANPLMLSAGLALLQIPIWKCCLAAVTKEPLSM